MAECRGVMSLNASVAINAKGGDCWKILMVVLMVVVIDGNSGDGRI